MPPGRKKCGERTVAYAASSSLPLAVDANKKATQINALTLVYAGFPIINEIPKLLI